MATIANAQSIDRTPQITPIDVDNLKPINDSSMPRFVPFQSLPSSSSSTDSIESEEGGVEVSRSPRFQ
jgi:hypothetical protein